MLDFLGKANTSIHGLREDDTARSVVAILNFRSTLTKSLAHLHIMGNVIDNLNNFKAAGIDTNLCQVASQRASNFT